MSEIENEWRDFYNHQVLNFTAPWADNEPNGGTVDNCAYVGNGKWADLQCQEKLFCVCQRQPFIHLRLRGLCTNSAIDAHYQPINDFFNFARLQLIGHKKSSIEYDEKGNNWKLSLAGSNVSGVSYAAQNTFLLGKQNWCIIGDSGCKTNGRGGA